MAPSKNTKGGRKSTGRKIIQPDGKRVYIAERIVDEKVMKIRGVEQTVYLVKFEGHPLSQDDWLTADNIGNYHLNVWNGFSDPEDDDEEEEEEEEDDDDSNDSDSDGADDDEDYEESELSELESDRESSGLSEHDDTEFADMLGDNKDAAMTDSAVNFDDGSDEAEGAAGEQASDQHNVEADDEAQESGKSNQDETVYEADDEMEDVDDDLADADGEVDEDPGFEARHTGSARPFASATHHPSTGTNDQPTDEPTAAGQDLDDVEMEDEVDDFVVVDLSRPEADYMYEPRPMQSLQGLLEQDLEMHGGGAINSKWRED